MKKLIFASILTLVLILPFSLHAQWARVYGGDGDDWANAIQQTGDGGYIVAGYTNSFGSELSDIWVAKLSFTGDIEWQNTFGGPQDEEAYSVDKTSDGGYIVAGYTDSFGLGKQDYWVLKLSSEGAVEWQQTFGGRGDDWANSVHQTSDGGFIVGGSSDSFGTGEVDFWVLKLSSEGAVEWQYFYALGVNSYLESIQETSDGGYIAAGHIFPSINNSHDLLILKLYSNGLIEWQRYYGGSQDDWANSIQQTDDGEYLVAGHTRSFGAGGWDFWVLRLTSIGNVDWERTYGRSGDEKAYSALQTSDGGFVVAGHTDSFGAGLSDFWLIKLSSSGNIEWQKTYGDIGEEAAHSIIQQTDGTGFVVAGYSDSYNTGDFDFLVLKLYSNGEIDSSCALPGDSAALIRNTGAGLGATLIPPQNPSALPQDTDVSPVPSDSGAYLVCEDRPEISGTVRTEGGVGIEGVTITFSGDEGEAITDSNGNYTHNVSFGWSGEATPAKAGYGFSPPGRTYSEVVSDQAGEDYTGFIVHIISGFVRDGGGAGIGDATIIFSNSGGEATTGSDGSYSHTVKEGWSGTATPSKDCYSFVPSSRSYTNVLSDQSGQDFTGTFLTYTISGTVRMASTSAPLSGVVMSGLPGNPVTDSSGYYEATVDCGWSGPVTPTMLRRVFSPVSRNYSDVRSDYLNQDYLAYQGWIISGVVSDDSSMGISGVTIIFSGDAGTALTGMDGSYAHTVIEGWSGTAIPSKSGYDFTPSSRNYTDVTADIPDQDYTGELIPYTLTISAGKGGTTQPEPGSYIHYYGAEVEVKAIPESGYAHSRWSGDVQSGLETRNPVVIFIDSNKSIEAVFDKEKLCFIASAAYGSRSHPHVQVLRDFRDRYLMHSKIGRMLVELYYKNSPSVAELISRYAALRVAARIHLLPFVGLSFAALLLGPWNLAVLLISSVVFPFLLALFRHRKKRRFAV